jgi:hypothetical protein
MSVNFACFVTCVSNADVFIVGNQITARQFPDFPVNCILLAMHQNKSVEIYIECDGVHQIVLLEALHRFQMFYVSIFTFGAEPMTNGAPEALARIRHRVGSDGFTGFYRGYPSVIESFDFSMRDELPNWRRFTADQARFLLAIEKSKPAEMVEWCVVVCSGNTVNLEARLNNVNVLKSGPARRYYIKGFLCSSVAREARIYMEVQPIVKTVLLRCLIEEFLVPTEVLTYAPDKQATALAFVSDLKGDVSQGGDLSEVFANVQPGSVTRFTRSDLDLWGCIVRESEPMHWSVCRRDLELHRLESELLALRKQKSLEVDYFSQHCVRLIGSLETVTTECDNLRKGVSVRVETVTTECDNLSKGVSVQVETVTTECDNLSKGVSVQEDT